ncbi:short-chain dehydrogenase/reductase SDR [Acidothermus cellulolyticus 11B]|jgi:short-subunit dehydrogenase|uniref:Short-chain dehydrogenase/reductase SDR n=1 Tax=Acidothermus cellulolyticus (strain ATCC 43068 / DSM 8971 / 11B) TaxID=351607 RepID=A0LWT4_ACIC1|nr:SDR family oxidoreductase [Acidothermus cellulolyticus]ABK53894.1 short-chain dehydrogenase/reductase SDR [Acidothermus cellulolyticus 11B]
MTRVLITGASAGIGRGFATQYAKLGHDLVLVSRDERRLADLAHELRTRHHVDVEVIPADLADPIALEKVEQRAASAEHPVDVLVNNAGFGIGTDFLHSSVETETQAIDVMIRAPMRLTKAVLPGMLERRSGAIIMVSSISGIVPHDSYGAIKAWVLRFSQVLSFELAGTGVRCIALCPGLTRTEFHDRAGIEVHRAPRAFWLDVDTVVRRCLVDLARGKTVSIPGWQYRLIAAVGRFLPVSWYGRLFRG